MGGASKGKKAKVAVQGEEGGARAPNPEIAESMLKLREMQLELANINVKADEEILDLEKKFMELRQPVFAKRNEVIGSINDFWKTVLETNPTLSPLITQDDRKILKHLWSLEVEEAKNVKTGDKDAKSAFSIIFNFSPNPYIEDEELTKTYIFNGEGNLSIICQPIRWKEVKGITAVDVHHKGVRRPDSSKSFFNWFSEAVQSDELDEIAEIIRDDIWPNPLKHFQAEVDARNIDAAMAAACEEDNAEETEGSKEADDEDDYNDEEEAEDDDDKGYGLEDGDDEKEDDDEGKNDGNADADVDVEEGTDST